MTHEEWLNAEYSQWIKALQESTIDNFREHPMVLRMLGDFSPAPFLNLIDKEIPKEVYTIDQIGWNRKELSGITARHVYYALQVLDKQPTAICEIGGGSGHFASIIRALGYIGNYWIYDLPEVMEFQKKFLKRVNELTELNTDLTVPDFDNPTMCLSFYALGEMINSDRHYYLENVIKKCSSGILLWNPHSGASLEIPDFPFTLIKEERPETHGIGPKNLQLEW